MSRPPAANKRRIVLVVQRYGVDIVGGAEAHARMIAERLAATAQFTVEVWTTTSRDFRVWDDCYPAGSSQLNGVTVRRFTTVRRRASWFKFANAALRLEHSVAAWVPDAARDALEHMWYEAQGPLSPDLLAALTAESARVDHFLFFTYLYHPTALGLPLVAAKASLVPTAHDEPALYTRVSRRLFTAARQLLVNSDAEHRLLVDLDPALAAKIRVAGVGIEIPPLPAAPAEPPRPYALYLGRIGRAKRIDQLLDAYAALRASGDAPWELWLGGTLDGDVTLEGRDGVRHLGFVQDERKGELLRQAAFIVNPSEYESLSLLVLEGLATGKPLLLNRSCNVFRDYALAVPTVALYEGQREFGEQAKQLLATDWQGGSGRARCQEAQAWLAARYGWDGVLTRYIEALS